MQNEELFNGFGRQIVERTSSEQPQGMPTGFRTLITVLTSPEQKTIARIETALQEMRGKYDNWEQRISRDDVTTIFAVPSFPSWFTAEEEELMSFTAHRLVVNAIRHGYSISWIQTIHFSGVQAALQLIEKQRTTKHRPKT